MVFSSSSRALYVRRAVNDLERDVLGVVCACMVLVVCLVICRRLANNATCQKKERGRLGLFVTICLNLTPTDNVRKAVNLGSSLTYICKTAVKLHVDC